MADQFKIDIWGEQDLTLDYDPKKYKTAAGAAKGLYDALLKACKARGIKDPTTEVWIKTPEETEEHGYMAGAWWVCWESGPFEWAVSTYVGGPWGHAEPYWGFDLAFYDDNTSRQ